MLRLNVRNHKSDRVDVQECFANDFEEEIPEEQDDTHSTELIDSMELDGLESFHDEDLSKELIDKLFALKDIVQYTFIDGVSVQYCDDRASTVLDVSQKLVDYSNNKVVYQFHFLDPEEVFDVESEISNG